MEQWEGGEEDPESDRPPALGPRVLRKVSPPFSHLDFGGRCFPLSPKITRKRNRQKNHLTNTERKCRSEAIPYTHTNSLRLRVTSVLKIEWKFAKKKKPSIDCKCFQ